LRPVEDYYFASPFEQLLPYKPGTVVQVQINIHRCIGNRIQTKIMIVDRQAMMKINEKIIGPKGEQGITIIFRVHLTFCT